jgi:hypothetical protein
MLEEDILEPHLTMIGLIRTVTAVGGFFLSIFTVPFEDGRITQSGRRKS